MPGTLGEIALEPVYMTDANGIRRLVAAPGDPIPATIGTFGIVTPPDPGVVVVPVAGYDDLTEDQVLALLPGLPEDELEQVRAYERAHLARGAIHRYGLTSGVVRSAGQPAQNVPAVSTSEGYDALDDDALVAELDARGLTVSNSGAAAKVRKARIAALQAHDAKSDQGAATSVPAPTTPE